MAPLPDRPGGRAEQPASAGAVIPLAASRSAVLEALARRQPHVQANARAGVGVVGGTGRSRGAVMGGRDGADGDSVVLEVAHQQWVVPPGNSLNGAPPPVDRTSGVRGGGDTRRSIGPRCASRQEHRAAGQESCEGPHR